MSTKINKKLKMRLLGFLLVTLGVLLLVYGIFFGSSNMSFWTIYIGLVMVATGLGFLGFRVGGYPF